ncbi:hypothetical protein [Cupriavidus sp. TMH.W2]|uniref:hypothetical protein n=1 Tax=Cupriavidus sp. TMH.W2 TaxID=3434465 RepID=UPI003D780D19
MQKRQGDRGDEEGLNPLPERVIIRIEKAYCSGAMAIFFLALSRTTATFKPWKMGSYGSRCWNSWREPPLAYTDCILTPNAPTRSRSKEQPGSEDPGSDQERLKALRARLMQTSASAGCGTLFAVHYLISRTL